MQVKLLSDLHFEFFPDETAVKIFIDTVVCDCYSNETVLLLAGDIHNHSNLSNTIEYLAQRFANVVYVAGNHEFYGTSYTRVCAQLEQLRGDNIHVLNPGVVELAGMKIIGATL